MAISSPAGMDIRVDAWNGVLSCLHGDPKAVLSLLQTCTALHGLADHEQVWQSVAEACWRHLAAVGRTGYRTYKGLVLDDNRANAAMALAFNSTACTYRFQQPLAFYECRLVQLQWWRTANSLRLYFDARGETDLRLPLDSSIAVIKLKDSPVASSAAQACSCSTAAPALGGAAHVAGGVPTCAGSFDLDAMGTRLLVHAPDACHTFVQKPGHYKGVLIWHSSKTTELLKALLMRQPADVEGPPPQQHSALSAGRRSEAWEEWADWDLEQQEVETQPEASSGTSGSNQPGPVGQLLRSCFRQWCNSMCSASSCNTSCCSSSAACAAAAGGGSGAAGAAGDAGSSSQVCAGSQGARHALVFCYANDLKWYHTMHTPDYSITPLAVATPVLAKVDSSSDVASSSSAQAAGRLCPSPQGRPYKQRGQVSKHLQRRTAEPLQLSKKEEGQLAAAWKALHGSTMQQCGALDQQLQAEEQPQEQLRWGGLPAAVKARGEGWWV